MENIKEILQEIKDQIKKEEEHLNYVMSERFVDEWKAKKDSWKDEIDKNNWDFVSQRHIKQEREKATNKWKANKQMYDLVISMTEAQFEAIFEKICFGVFEFLKNNSSIDICWGKMNMSILEPYVTTVPSTKQRTVVPQQYKISVQLDEKYKHTDNSKNEGLKIDGEGKLKTDVKLIIKSEALSKEFVSYCSTWSKKLGSLRKLEQHCGVSPFKFIHLLQSIKRKFNF